MIIDLLTKVANKLIDKTDKPEDLILMIMLFILGIAMTLLFPKLWNKPEKSEKNEKAVDLCPNTAVGNKCKNVTLVLEELQDLQDQIIDVSVRLTKIMNVLSKEYNGHWDRYLFDKDVSPKETCKTNPEK